jgi:molybdenum cofactor cytidylyltransferase
MAMKKVAVVVLAAGMSKRFGVTKQLVKLENGKSLVQNAIDIAVNSRADYVLLVLGYEASEIMRELTLGRAQLVLNVDFRSGLASSVRAGVSNLPIDSSAAIFMVADQPYLSSIVLNQMIEKFHESSLSKYLTIALSEKGEPRNPVLISSKLFPELMSLDGDVGAKVIVRKHFENSFLLEWEDPIIFVDIDAREDADQFKGLIESS